MVGGAGRVGGDGFLGVFIPAEEGVAIGTGGDGGGEGDISIGQDVIAGLGVGVWEVRDGGKIGAVGVGVISDTVGGRISYGRKGNGITIIPSRKIKSGLCGKG